MNSFKAITPRHEIKIEYYYDYVKTNNVKTNKGLFRKMCLEGCRNYNKKYCCPPDSPSFESVVKCDKLFVLLFKMNLAQLDYSEYHKVRLANAVLKNRIEKVMRELEKTTNTKFLSTGACRLCKPCKKKLGMPCAHPENMRYSLESLGVDCNHLSKKLFDIELKWYDDKKAPEYTCVICALPTNKIISSSAIKLIINQ